MVAKIQSVVRPSRESSGFPLPKVFRNLIGNCAGVVPGGGTRSRAPDGWESAGH